MICFNCQQDGHMAWQCPWKNELGQAQPATHAGPWPPHPAPRIIPDPPSATYLAARDELGHAPSRNAAELLSVKCPWCDAGPWQNCVNRALGTIKQRAHEARYQAAGLTAPARPDLADIALRQVQEFRAARAASPPDIP